MSIDGNPAVSRHLSVIYADDLRQEIGGKITIIGMYEFSLQLMKDEEILQSLDLDLTDEEAVGPSAIQQGATTREFNFATIIGPLQLDGPCKLSVRLQTESGIICSRPLIIEAAQSVATHQTP
jgi:hypothetical protein